LNNYKAIFEYQNPQNRYKIIGTMKPYLSIVIPCYNEERNLNPKVLITINEFLKKKDFSWEVIISDDGSTDKSREIVVKQIKKLPNFRLLKNPHGGKPLALWYGIKDSHGEYVLFADMDQSTPISELDKLLPFTGDKIGAVIGSRGLIRKNYPLYRRLGSIIFVTVRKLFILPEIDDTQCGFKLFKREVAVKAFPNLQFFKKTKETKGWSVTSYDVEILHIIKKMDFLIEEVPVIWEDKDISTSKGGGLGRYFKESKEMLSQILRVKVNDLRGLYTNL
jgi:dolichyl-phosphate beta-glucosyltransferase